MKPGLDVAFFGSSLVSAYWNGAATYYRGVIRALHERGHRVTFYEPDAYDRQKNRDIPDPDWARVAENPADPFRALIPRYDLVLTYGGGDPVVRAYERLGARHCVPIYNGLDP